jgi:hypothetical protein
MLSLALFNQASAAAAVIDWGLVLSFAGFGVTMVMLAGAWVRWSHQQGRMAQQLDDLRKQFADLEMQIQGTNGALSQLVRLSTLVETLNRSVERLTDRHPGAS